jgi:putative multiple sugar transport system substrate-binding protein
VKGDSWNIEDQKKAMLDRLGSYGAGECPDMVLAAADNASQGAIAALEEKGIANMPVITGQDNSALSQTYIKSGKQTMTIDKNLKDMAYNTAMIVNGLISNSPVYTSQSISGIPAIYSKITVMTKDSY